MGLLRFLLALMVVLHHSNGFFGYKYLNPVLAVQAFFVISGFYMTLILKEKYVGKDSKGIFYSNRVLRIFPAYWLVLFLTIIVSLLLEARNQINIYSFDLSTFITDLTILVRTDYLEINPNNNVNMTIDPAWTLVLELCFYLAAPFMVRNPKRVIILLIGSIFIRYILYDYSFNNSIPLTNRFFPAEIMYFLLGSVSYYIYLLLKDNWKNKIEENKAIFLSVILIFLTIFYEYIFPGFRYMWMDLGYVIFILSVMLSIPFLFKFTSRIKLDRYIGELSYPMYISHSFIILLFTNLFLFDINNKYFSTGVLFATIIFSSLVVVFLEMPIDKWRQSRVKKIK